MMIILNPDNHANMSSSNMNYCIIPCSSSIRKDVETDPASLLAMHSYTPLWLMLASETSMREDFLAGMVTIRILLSIIPSNEVVSFIQLTLGIGIPSVVHSRKNGCLNCGFRVKSVPTMTGRAIQRNNKLIIIIELVGSISRDGPDIYCIRQWLEVRQLDAVSSARGPA